MAVDLLPLFPLKLVALPGAPVPLHIFEERYKEMVGIAIEQQTEFGIVLAHEQGVANIGCAVFVEKVLDRKEDGRMDILCRGSRRFEIVLLNEEKDYLRATVQFFDDESEKPLEGGLSQLRQDTFAAWRELVAKLAEEPIPEFDLNDPQLSFRMASTVGDLNMRQVLLQMRTEEERLQQLLSFFRTFESRQQRIQEARRLAPTNGHAKSSMSGEDA
jgi:Lon protease-like protein